MKTRKIIIFCLVLGFGFFVFKKAVFAQTFTFSPTTASKKVAEEFTVTVTINSGTTKIKGADLKILYNEELLDMTVAKGDFFPEGGENISDGLAYLSYGIDQALVSKEGSGVFAIFTLKGKSEGTAKLTVECSSDTTDSNIWGEASTDIINCALISDPSFEITNAGSVPEPTNTLTPTSIPTPASGGTATATPTPPVSGITLPTVFSLGAGVILTILGFAFLL